MIWKYSLAFSPAQHLLSMLNHEFMTLIFLANRDLPYRFSINHDVWTDNKVCYWNFYNADTIHNLLKLHDLQWISTETWIWAAWCIYCTYHWRSNRNHQCLICLCCCWLINMILYSNITSQKSRGNQTSTKILITKHSLISYLPVNIATWQCISVPLGTCMIGFGLW